ncbi:MAG: glycosyltransferase family 4 protein [Hydrogenimonas sp.]|nr:glycosyltransferase family 4 protein [Hydrogenimonas sp.]
MKICLIIDDYLPESIKIGAKMMHELACELLSHGNDVTVITPSSKLKRGYSVENLDGITVCRFKSGRIKNVGRVERAINETLLSFRAWNSLKWYLAQNHHDLVVYYSPTIFWGPLVKRVKKLWGARTYLVLRDIFPQWAVDRGLIRKNSIIERYFLYFEDLNYSAADKIGLMSKKNLEWFKKSKKTDAKLEILPNWASIEPVASSGEHRRQLKLEDKVIFFYGGNIGQAQDMMNIVRLAKRMQKHKKAHFLLVGAGDEVELVKKAIEKESLQNMTLLPPVSQKTFKELQADCDVGLFTLHKDHTTHNFPGKLLGYMVQSMPILGSINPGNDLKETIEEAKAGFISINGDDDLFFENCVKLLDEKIRDEIGKNSFKLLEKSFYVKSAAYKIIEAEAL